MIDITTERLIPLKDVPKLEFLPQRRAGSRLAVSTVFRWTLNSRHGRRLESVMVGGMRCTSLQALQRFFNTLKTVETQSNQQSCLNARKLSEKGVEKALDKLGI